MEIPGCFPRSSSRIPGAACAPREHPSPPHSRSQRRRQPSETLPIPASRPRPSAPPLGPTAACHWPTDASVGRRPPAGARKAIPARRLPRSPRGREGIPGAGWRPPRLTDPRAEAPRPCAARGRHGGAEEPPAGAGAGAASRPRRRWAAGGAVGPGGGRGQPGTRSPSPAVGAARGLACEARAPRNGRPGAPGAPYQGGDGDAPQPHSLAGLGQPSGTRVACE